MLQSEGDPSDGKNLANELDALFRSGNLDVLSAPTPAEPAQPAVDEVLKVKLNQYMNSFVSCINPDLARSTGRRSAVNQVRRFFSEWKPGIVNTLRTNRASQSETQAVDNLTLKNVAAYANEQFSQASKDAGRLPLGSLEQREARERSNYWSIMEEIISPAADPDK